MLGASHRRDRYNIIMLGASHRRDRHSILYFFRWLALVLSKAVRLYMAGAHGTPRRVQCVALKAETALIFSRHSSDI